MNALAHHSRLHHRRGGGDELPRTGFGLLRPRLLHEVERCRVLQRQRQADGPQHDEVASQPQHHAGGSELQLVHHERSCRERGDAQGLHALGQHRMFRYVDQSLQRQVCPRREERSGSPSRQVDEEVWQGRQVQGHQGGRGLDSGCGQEPGWFNLNLRHGHHQGDHDVQAEVQDVQEVQAVHEGLLSELGFRQAVHEVQDQGSYGP